MRILLVHPPIGPRVIGPGVLFLAEPLALETIAAPIEDHETRILDMRIDRKWGQLQGELVNFSPHIVGVTALTTEAYQALDVLRTVKEFNTSILTVVGGQHATFMPEDFNRTFVDVIVIGEGVFTFKELVSAYDQKRDLKKIRGIATGQNGTLSFTKPRPPSLSLDDMPIPARHLTERYRENYFRGTWRPYASIVTSRGCPFRCKFCAVWKTEGGKYRVRSPEKVLEELGTIKQDYISVSDDNFLHDVARAERIYELIKAEGIKKKYKLIARSDTIVRRPDIVVKWKEIGLEIMIVGIESFRDSELKDINKKTTAKQNNEAIKILQDNGVTVSAHFIVRQDYDEEDFKALAEYVESMGLKQPIFCVLTPLPGTDLYEETKHNLLTTDYEKFDLMHTVLPTKLPIKEFYKQFVDLYRKCYLKEGQPSPETFVAEEILLKGFAKFAGIDAAVPAAQAKT